MTRKKLLFDYAVLAGIAAVILYIVGRGIGAY
jgi:hypothetical protein